MRKERLEKARIRERLLRKNDVNQSKKSSLSQSFSKWNWLKFFPKEIDRSLFQKELIKELHKKEDALFYNFFYN